MLGKKGGGLRPGGEKKEKSEIRPISWGEGRYPKQEEETIEIAAADGGKKGGRRPTIGGKKGS